MHSQEFAELQQSIRELKETVAGLRMEVQKLTEPVQYETQPELMQVAESGKVAGNEQTHITAPGDVYELVKHTAKLEQEELRAVLLNRRNRVIDVVMVFRGTMDSSIIDPRDIFRIALRKRAVSIILSHNHPSGDAEPSPEDTTATRQILEAGKLLNIQLLDHVIIGNEWFVSLKERGLLG